MNERPAKPTLRTVASHLGVSVTTVSRALRRGSDVHPDTIERVFRAAENLGYARDVGALGLRTGRTYTITAFLTAPQRNAVSETGSVSILHGMHDALVGSDYRLNAVTVSAGEDHLELVRQIVDGRSADGIVFDHTTVYDSKVKYLLDRNFPFVCLGRTAFQDNHPWIDIDDEDAAYRQTMDVLSAGRRRPVLLNAPGQFFFARERERGYRRALRESGVADDRAVVVNTDLTVENTLPIVEALLRRPDRPDGFVCTTQFVMIAVYDVIRTLGLDFDDFTVVVQDNFGISRYFHPRPIAYGFPLRDIGRMMINILLRRLDGETDPAHLRHLLTLPRHPR